MSPTFLPFVLLTAVAILATAASPLVLAWTLTLAGRPTSRRLGIQLLRAGGAGSAVTIAAIALLAWTADGRLPEVTLGSVLFPIAFGFSAGVAAREGWAWLQWRELLRRRGEDEERGRSV